MVAVLRKCAWCGHVFEAKTKRAVYCGPRCRKAHNRAHRAGIRIGTADGDPPRVKSRMDEGDVAAAVVQAKGAMAAFDAGRARAPKELRPLCSVLADAMARMFEAVGL